MLRDLQSNHQDLDLYSSRLFDDKEFSGPETMNTEDLQFELAVAKNPFKIRDITDEAIIPGAQKK